MKPRHIRKTVMDDMNLDEGNLPNDFPAEQAMKNKLSALKAVTRKRQ